MQDMYVGDGDMTLDGARQEDAYAQQDGDS